MKKNYTVGIFPYSLDGMMIEDTSNVFKIKYLVAKNTLEKEWTQRFLPAADLIFYDYDDSKGYFSCQTTDSIIKNSNLTDVLKRNTLDALLITRLSNRDLERWGKQNKITIISTKYSLQAKLNNKLWFDAFLEKNNLPKPKSGIFKPNSSTFPIQADAVIQNPWSEGGEGTFFIHNEDDLRKLVQSKTLHPDKPYLVRKFMEGNSYGISVFISSDIIALSAIRLQCTLKNPTFDRELFAGVHWVTSDGLSAKLKNKISETFLRLGKLLHAQKYLGYAGFDFIIDDKEGLYILECNPRFSDATPQLIKYPELVSSLPTGEIFLNESLAPPKFVSNPHLYSYPETDFNGSMLYVHVLPEITGRKTTIEKEYRNGLYEYKNRKPVFYNPDIRKLQDKDNLFIYYSDTKRGEVYTKNETVGSVTSNFPLYNSQGKINHDAKILMNYFTYSL